MESLRRPLFFLAVALLVVAILIEIGGVIVLNGFPASVDEIGKHLENGPTKDTYNALMGNPAKKAELIRVSADRPPGMGVPYLALLDAVLLFTVALMGVSLLIPERVQGRIQGVATLIFSLVVLIVGIVLIIKALVLLLLMVSLLLSVPFGTLVYLAIYGFFDVGGANVALSLLMLLNLGFAGSLVLAHQRFLQNKGLVLLILTAIVGIVIVGFLIGLLPGFLASITDAVAAIIIAILAVIWAIVLLIGSLVSVVKAIRLRA